MPIVYELDGLETDRWRIDRYLKEGLPSFFVNFIEVERPLSEPPRAKNIRIEVWENLLNEKMHELSAADSDKSYEVDHDKDTGSLALYETRPERRRLNYDGPTINMSHCIQSRGSLVVATYPIRYSEWMACLEKEFSRAYLEEHGELPKAGIGVSTVIKSSDDFIPLTIRDTETINYPGRLFTQGGGPKPGEKSAESVLKEVAAETGMNEFHYDKKSMKWVAYLTDTKWMGTEHERPEFVAFLDSNLEYHGMEKLYREKVGGPKKPTDIRNIIPFSSEPSVLSDQIFFEGHRMCPSTEPSLMIRALHENIERQGEDIALELFMNDFGRINSHYRGEASYPVPRDHKFSK